MPEIMQEVRCRYQELGEGVSCSPPFLPFTPPPFPILVSCNKKAKLFIPSNMKDKTQKYISSQRPEKSHLLPAQKDLSVHDTFCWVFLFVCLFVWDFTVAGILNLVFLGGGSLGEFF